MDHLDYVEREAAKNMEFHMQNLDDLKKDCNLTLTFLYVVIAAAFTGVVKLIELHTSPSLALALSLLCIYLAVLAVSLVFACLWTRDVQAPSNEPANLNLKDGYSSEEIRRFELDNLQIRITLNRSRNEVTARRLNYIRVMICLSPIVFTIPLLLLTGLFWAVN